MMAEIKVEFEAKAKLPNTVCGREYNNNLKHGWMAPHVLPKPPKTRACLRVETGSNHALRGVLRVYVSQFITKE